MWEPRSSTSQYVSTELLPVVRDDRRSSAQLEGRAAHRWVARIAGRRHCCQHHRRRRQDDGGLTGMARESDSINIWSV
jgi:alkylhydroperoxidase family enzyme